MLVSQVLEKTAPSTAAENMANHLADQVRNIWLANRNAGLSQWEENFFEGPDAISFLRGESFPGLLGIDYIFKWWGDEKGDVDGLAGELEVLWKVQEGHGVSMYKTWIRFADRDFIIGTIREETQKREANRKEFRDAIATWQKLYVEKVGSK